MDETDVAGLVDSLKAGEFDGHLNELLEAIRLRLTLGTTEIKWKVTFEGEDITQDSLTLAEAAFVERTTLTSWANLNPVNSAGECQAIIAMALHMRQGVGRKEAMDRAGALGLEDAVAAVGSYEVDRAPKDSAA